MLRTVIILVSGRCLLFGYLGDQALGVVLPQICFTIMFSWLSSGWLLDFHILGFYGLCNMMAKSVALWKGSEES